MQSHRVKTISIVCKHEDELSINLEDWKHIKSINSFSFYKSHRCYMSIFKTTCNILAAFVLCYHSITMSWEIREYYSGSQIFLTEYTQSLLEATPLSKRIHNIKVTAVGSIAFGKRKQVRPRERARKKQCGV